MNLELIYTPATITKAKGSLLLLHGACHAAWMWEDNFAPWFAQNGFHVYAMSLRNHGNSDYVPNLKSIRIKDYVKDLASVVDTLKGPVYLIGHSMGGFVIQHYLMHEHRKVTKALLLCSIPPKGLWRITLKTLQQFPLAFFKGNFTRSLEPIFKNPIIASRYIFSGKISMAQTKAIAGRLQDDSYLAYIDTLFLDLPKPQKVNTPVMVVGGEDDFLFGPKDIQATADAYGVEAHIIKGASHNLMMQPGWEYTARLIYDFFNENLAVNEKCKNSALTEVL